MAQERSTWQYLSELFDPRPQEAGAAPWNRIVKVLRPIAERAGQGVPAVLRPGTPEYKLLQEIHAVPPAFNAGFVYPWKRKWLRDFMSSGRFAYPEWVETTRPGPGVLDKWLSETTPLHGTVYVSDISPLATALHETPGHTVPGPIQKMIPYKDYQELLNRWRGITTRAMIGNARIQFDPTHPVREGFADAMEQVFLHRPPPRVFNSEYGQGEKFFNLHPGALELYEGGGNIAFDYLRRQPGSIEGMKRAILDLLQLTHDVVP